MMMLENKYRNVNVEESFGALVHFFNEHDGGKLTKPEVSSIIFQIPKFIFFFIILGMLHGRRKRLLL